LRREDFVVIACTALAVALAWIWLALGGGLSMAAMMAEPWSAAYLAPAFTMWALMMVAMMLPSALPMILLHARVARQASGAPLPGATLVFALAYVVLWSGFALAAALGQAALVASGAVSAMTLTLGSRTAVALLLLVAALYQVSALKRACLDKCRSPLSFILRGFKPEWRAALRLGLAYGLYCIGCCWALMLLLFVGGVMNLAWVAALGTVVIAEKYGPAWTARAMAVLMVAGAAGLVAVPG
jgi:predicted metal-binding membrane protein